MALIANSARGMPPRVHRAYRLEMSGRTLLTLLLLLSLTGLVVFYLGVMTGKGMRDPNAPTIAATAPGATPGTPGAATNPANLTFNQSLGSTAPQIEGLKTEQSKLSDNTNKLVAQAKQELELEEVSAKSTQTAPAKPAPKPAAVPPAAAKPAATVAAAPAPKPSAVAPAAKPAAKPAPAMSGEGGYTVQVFSSTKQANAQDLVNTLKSKGFPAYLNQFQADDKQVWYRVRVGKGTKPEADAMAARLIKDGGIKAPRVLQQ